MAYEKCRDVSEEIWQDFEARDPQEIFHRTGAVYQGGGYRLPFLDRSLRLDPARRQVQFAETLEAEPGFRLCLPALMYRLHINPTLLGPSISPLELPGRGHLFPGPPRPARRALGRALRPGRGRF